MEDWPEWSKKKIVMAFVIKYPHMQKSFEKESLPDFAEEEAAAPEEAKGFKSQHSAKSRLNI